jgi:hypothetical protein
MDVLELYKNLSKEEKEILRELINEEKSKNKYRITAGEWIELMGNKLSRRLQNAFMSSMNMNNRNVPRIYWWALDDINIYDMLNQKNTGWQTWVEFREARKEYFESI